MSKVVIYALIDDDGRHFYVGSTSIKLKYRLSAHTSRARSAREPIDVLACRIRGCKHGPWAVPLQLTDEDTRFETEHHWIRKLRSLGEDLVNHNLP